MGKYFTEITGFYIFLHGGFIDCLLFAPFLQGIFCRRRLGPRLRVAEKNQVLHLKVGFGVAGGVARAPAAFCLLFRRDIAGSRNFKPRGYPACLYGDGFRPFPSYVGGSLAIPRFGFRPERVVFSLFADKKRRSLKKYSVCIF